MEVTGKRKRAAMLVSDGGGHAERTSGFKLARESAGGYFEHEYLRVKKGWIVALPNWWFDEHNSSTNDAFHVGIVTMLTDHVVRGTIATPKRFVHVHCFREQEDGTYVSWSNFPAECEIDNVVTSGYT